MDAEWLKDVEPMVHESRIKVPYSWSVGDIGSRFLMELRDKKRILGKKCEECGHVFVPPRKMCHRCFRDTGPWVEVGPVGTVVSYTIVHYDNGLQPIEPPIAYGLIRLDGASTGLLHLLGEVDPKDIRDGLRVEPAFKQQRTGHILDIAYFKPVQG